MSFDQSNFDENLPEEEQLPEESNNNRTFLIAAGILGGIILISVACLGVIFVLNRNADTQTAALAVAGTETASASLSSIGPALTATFEASIQPTATLAPTQTSVVNLSTATLTPDPNATLVTNTPAAGTAAAATATVGAALTQAAIAQLTVVPTTTALPNTGFADEFGIPGLVVMALAFIIVILMARSLRFTPNR